MRRLDPQPDTIVNNCNSLEGDLSSPQQRIVAEKGRAWEACMTMNGSWGYHSGDDDWKTAKTVVRNLITCARQGGNYLLNIGPKPDGGIPEESVQILTAVGQWIDRNGATIYGTESCQVRGGEFGRIAHQGSIGEALRDRPAGEICAGRSARAVAGSARGAAIPQPMFSGRTKLLIPWLF